MRSLPTASTEEGNWVRKRPGIYGEERKVDPEDHVEHRILNPVHVWLKTGDNGESDTLEIETADDFKTLIQLQPIPALP
jgi:hypothetical protein